VIGGLISLLTSQNPSVSLLFTERPETEARVKKGADRFINFLFYFLWRRLQPLCPPPIVISILLRKCTDLPISDYGVGHMIPENIPGLSHFKDAVSVLPGMGEASSNPYCVFSLIDKNTSEQVCVCEGETSPHLLRRTKLD